MSCGSTIGCADVPIDSDWIAMLHEQTDVVPASRLVPWNVKKEPDGRAMRSCVDGIAERNGLRRKGQILARDSR